MRAPTMPNSFSTLYKGLRREWPSFDLVQPNFFEMGLSKTSSMERAQYQEKKDSADSLKRYQMRFIEGGMGF